MARDRSVLDGPLARLVAAAVVGGAGYAIFLVSEDAAGPNVQAAAASASGAAFATCVAEREGHIAGLLADGVIDDAKAGLFRDRAAALCRSQVEGQ